MVDQYICDTRLPLVPTPLLLTLYKMACQFDMPTMEGRYVVEIMKRINTKTIYEVSYYWVLPPMVLCVQYKTITCI